ncbi:MAG: polysaccharide pyruvyl transferase CsaB [Defluviitaleaceae bacterium]|nr:polysaccharide pyruvyl transferase CsaB [Defluviitaleaceae bacterium]
MDINKKKVAPQSVLHLISGGDKGGAKTHVFTLLTALSEEIDVTVACFMEGVFYNEVKNLPIKSILLKQKFRNDLTIINPLVSHIKKENYDIIHAHGARANFIAMFLRPFIDKPIVTTIHSDYNLDFTENIYKKYVYTSLNKVSLSFADYYIAVSNNFKQMLVERNYESNKIFTVYNTIDFEQKPEIENEQNFFKTFPHTVREKIKKETSASTPPNTVGIIGRFDKVKGHEIFIKAAAIVLKYEPNTIFLLAGEGPEEQNLKKLAKNLNIEKNIIFLGFVEDIFSFINVININVLTSYSESFPYVLLEGALLKKPTISTAVGGVTDLIKENKTGMLANPGDYKQIAKKIIALIKNKPHAEKLGKNLFEHASKNFSKESMKRRHIEIYEEILNDKFDIVLSGYYGFDNSGDDALLKAVIETIRKYKPDVRILVLSKQPKQTMEEHNVKAINRYDYVSISKYFKASKLFIYGGGSLIQDATSTKSLFYYTFLLKLAKRSGMKLMVYGNGIGPINKITNIKRAKEALALCDYISLREDGSYKEIKALGINTDKVTLTVDPAFALEPGETKFRAKKEFFIVSCRNWKDNDPYLADKIAHVVLEKSIEYDLEPIYMPMHENDKEILERIMRKAKVRGRMLEVKSVSEMIAIIKEARFVLSMRLHTLVYAISTNTPVIGISYDPKVDYFIKYAGQKFCLDAGNLNFRKLERVIDYIEKNYEELKQDIEKNSKRLKSLSENDAKAAIELLKNK